MSNLRGYGKAPFRNAAIHGGPGAAGEVAPVAQELASSCGILEPFQTALSIDGQVEELRLILENHADLPVTLIGYSWGAWLSTIMAARYPTLVSKLVLVSSGPFEEHYVQGRQQVRLSRLNDADRAEFQTIADAFGNLTGTDQDRALARLSALSLKADTFDTLKDDDPVSLDPRADIFQSVWPEAADLRRSGQLLTLARQVRCPVVAIHGDYDSHPAEGIRKPLSQAIADFQFVQLNRCGHKPWLERHAKERFYEILRQVCQ